MSRFQFRLKSLLAIRETTRDLRRAELAESLALERSLNEREAALQRELDDQNQWFRRGTAPGPLNVDRLSTGHRYQLLLRRQARTLAGERQSLALEIERRRQVLLEADREVRVLEKLRERQFEHFRRQLAAAEVKQLDEAAARTTNRNDPD
jgi:flagellar FliJ protein